MRRLLLPSSLLLIAASIWVLAIASTAGAAGGIACPQMKPSIVPCCPTPVGTVRAAPDAVPCCPTPTNGGCCGTTTTPCCTTTCCTTTCCPTSCAPGGLTIASSPDPSVAGRKLVISGGLTKSPVAGTQVVLWHELAGGSSFRKLTSTTTDSAGQYKITLKAGTVNADQKLYVTANGLQSPTLAQRVGAVVGLAGSSSATAGKATLLRGRVSPSHAGQAVLIEQRRGAKWVVIARPRLGKASKYGVMHTFGRTGTVALRTVLPGDARNNRSNSRTLTVTVKS